MTTLRSTTVLLVRRGGVTCMASDGQVTMGQSTVVKSGARKVRRAGKAGSVLVGFAGGGADALALFARLEAKLEEYSGNLERGVVELARDWRTDRALRQLDALMLVADRDRAFLVAGNGELLQPDEEGGAVVVAIGSGSNYALAAAKALLRHTAMPARDIVVEAMGIAADICVFTNHHLTIEEL